MCLILVAWQVSAEFPLVLAANRDEYFDRPTTPAHAWKQPPGLLAGRDERAGGTWLGMDRQLRIAAVTNLREPPPIKAARRSRGLLTVEFLSGTETAEACLDRLVTTPEDYDGFNLLLGERDQLWFMNSRAGKPRRLAPGIYGISNGDLDCPWPKVERGKSALQQVLAAGLGPLRPAIAAALYDVLADRSVPSDENLPDTGVGIEWERRLAPAFVSAGYYGTRSSSVILGDAVGGAYFAERTFDARGAVAGEVKHWLPIL